MDVPLYHLEISIINRLLWDLARDVAAAEPLSVSLFERAVCSGRLIAYCARSHHRLWWTCASQIGTNPFSMKNKYEIKKQFRLELKKCKKAKRIGNVEKAWFHLERSHVLGQGFAGLHTQSHFEMLKLSFTTKDRYEFFIQSIFVKLSGLSSVFGFFPAGNRGRAQHITNGTMPIDTDLKSILQ